ncbi:MAG: BLUF domain-containing protein [Betaproteobacteria bacterium]
MLSSLVYTSLATVPFPHHDLFDLLEKARATNQTLDVTGMLLYKDGAFMQALEGEEAVVEKLADKISHDPHHTSYFVCSRQHLDRRQFPDWSMGFADLDAAAAGANTAGYSDFMRQPLTREAIERDPTIVNRLLLMFRN